MKNKPIKTEKDVLAMLDGKLEKFGWPQEVHIYQKHSDIVIASRRRNQQPEDSESYLNFTSYRGVRLIVVETDNDSPEKE